MKYLFAVLVVCSAVATTWSYETTPVGTLSEARFEIVALYDKQDTIYLIGGRKSDGSGVSDILKFNINSGEIEKAGEFPEGLSQGSAHFDSTSKNIYYFGGEHSNGSKSNAVWKIQTEESFSVNIDGNLPFGIANHCSVNNGTSSYMIMGGFTTKLQDELYHYDTNVHNSDIVHNIKTLKRASSVCVLGDSQNVFVFGGHSGEFVSTISEFNLIDGSVKEIGAKFPFGITGSTGIKYGNDAIIVGGGNGVAFTQKHQMSHFDMSSKKLTPLTVDGMRNNLYRPGAVYVPKLNRIYVFGGREYGVREGHGQTETVDEIFYIQF